MSRPRTTNLLDDSDDEPVSIDHVAFEAPSLPNWSRTGEVHWVPPERFALALRSKRRGTNLIKSIADGMGYDEDKVLVLIRDNMPGTDNRYRWLCRVDDDVRGYINHGLDVFELAVGLERDLPPLRRHFCEFDVLGWILTSVFDVIVIADLETSVNYIYECPDSDCWSPFSTADQLIGDLRRFAADLKKKPRHSGGSHL